MADVGHGRMLVLAALLLAVRFVGLAFVLNGGIFAENLGRRETPSEPSDSSRYRIQFAVSDTSGRATTAGKHCGIDPAFCEEAGS